MQKRTFRVRVLGCKVNQYEACQIEQVLRESGLVAASKGEKADVVVVHGCAVTAVAARKSRQVIRRMRQEHPYALLVMTGCGADSRIFDAGTEQCLTVPAGEHLLRDLAQAVSSRWDVDSSVGSADRYVLDAFSGRTRAFLKIQDGCSIGCSYCIVPSLRGASRDKPLDVILKEAQTLVAHGYRELVVAGVSVGLYGQKTGISLARVLRELLTIEGLDRLRMSSLHPQEISDELLNIWSSTPRMMPHVHLPLQSGSDKVLKGMRRGYTRASYLDAIERFRSILDRPAFTTDVIVGFPGEDEEAFRDTVGVAETACFSKMHIFPYSERPGTVATSFSGKIPSEIAKKRVANLQKTSFSLAKTYFSQFLGQIEYVLVEKEVEKGVFEGRGEHYFPIRFSSDTDCCGMVVPVRIDTVESELVRGTVFGA